MDAPSGGTATARGEVTTQEEWAGAVPALLWTSTSEGAVTAANGRWRTFTGVDPAVVETSWLDLVHPDDRARVVADPRRQHDRDEIAADVRLRRHDGAFVAHALQLVAARTSVGTDAWYGSAVAAPSPLRSADAEATASMDADGLFDTAHVGMAVVAAGRGGIRRANATCCAITARTSAELTALRLADLAPEDAAARLGAAIDRVSRGEQAVYDADERLRQPDGTIVWVRLRAAATGRADGRPRDVVVVLDDITARKAVEDALALSEERLRLATTSAGIATFDYDVIADRAHWSPELYTMLGVPPGPVYSQADFLVHVHPDDRARLIATNSRTLQPDGPKTLAREFRIRRADTGEVRWISHVAHVHFAPVDGVVRPVRANGVLVDITERKAAEARDALLLRLHETLRPIQDPVEIQEAAARVLGEHLGVSRVAYAEVTGDDLDVVIARNYVAPDVVPITGRFRLRDYGAAFLAPLRAGARIVEPDVAGAATLGPEERAAYASLGVGALIAVPLVKNGRFVAVLTVLHTGPRVWSPGDVTLVAETAERTWAAVERSRIEADLRESEARYRAMFDLSQVGKAELDLPAGRVRLANRALCDMLERSETDLVGRPVIDWLFPEDRADVTAALAGLAAGGSEVLRAEWRWPRADGTIAWLAVDATLIRDDRGLPWRAAAVFLDVSERKWAEARLQRSETRFRTLAESAPVGIFRADLRGRGTYVNAAWLADFGVTLEHASTGEHWADRVHPDDRARVVRAWRDTVASRQEWQAEYRIVRPDGAVTWMLGRAVPEVDERGRVVGYVGMTMDISARKAGEQALQASAQRQALIVRITDAIRQLTDPAELTRIACTLLGTHLRADRVSYADIDEAGGVVIGPDYAADARPSLAGTFDLAQAPLAGRAMARGEVVVVRDVEQTTATSATRALLRQLQVASYVCAPVRRDGRLVGALVATTAAPRDWHELDIATIDKIAHLTWTSLERVRAEIGLRESEARFRLMADQTPIMLWVTDEDGRLEFVNREYSRFFGVTQPDLEERGWQELVHPDDLGAYAAAFAHALGAHAPFGTVARGRRADGVWRWMTAHALPRQAPNGRYLGMIGVLTDITEARAAAEAMEAAARQKDDFIAVLAHELRNPLAPIRTTVGVLRRRETADPALTRCFDIVERQVAHMSRLLDDLLDVSRLEQGKLTLQTAPVRLVDVIDTAIETARPLIDARHHALDVQPIDPALVVTGDQVRLTQVFANLLNNAAKYTDPHGSITVRADARAGAVTVAIVDSGIGLAPDLLPVIFTPFVQGREAAFRGEGGVGIGLGLARRLVELHHGTLEAKSEGLGRGSTFTVTLPLLVRTEPVVADAALAAAAPSAPPPVRHRVLVADDNVDAAETLGLLLEPLGCDVRLVHDGRSALAEARAFRPALILLDVGLPGMDGRTVCERLRSEPWSATSLFAAVTGWGQEADRRASLAAGFHHHLVKPVDPAVLVSLVQALPDPPPPTD